MDVTLFRGMCETHSLETAAWTPTFMGCSGISYNMWQILLVLAVNINGTKSCWSRNMFLVSVIALENRKQANAENHTSLKIKVHELHRIITRRFMNTFSGLLNSSSQTSKSWSGKNYLVYSFLCSKQMDTQNLALALIVVESDDSKVPENAKHMVTFIIA